MRALDERSQAMIDAIGIPGLSVHTTDYGQEVIAEVDGGHGCFIRFGRRYAAVDEAAAIREYLLTPRDGLVSREEIFQFLRDPVTEPA